MKLITKILTGLLGVGASAGLVKVLTSDVYNKDGFNFWGKDKEGYNREGYNSEGYDRDGYNSQGFNRYGRDREDRDKWGYDRNGYDKRGYDKQGYDKYGYNIRKEDRAGHSRDYYKEREEKYRNKLSEAVQELHDHDYSHALSDSRVIMDEVLRNIVGHYKVNQESNDMLTNLKICEELKIFDEEDLGALHAVRKKCNSNGHDIDAVETMSHNAIHFVVMQVADLLEQSKTLLDIQE